MPSIIIWCHLNSKKGGITQAIVPSVLAQCLVPSRHVTTILKLIVCVPHQLPWTMLGT
jgi:hypothetical protein